MQARYVTDTDLETLLDPESQPWRSRPPTLLPLMGTPLGLQPTGAIRVAWADKPIGAVAEVAVSAVHDGTILAFRLEWEDASENGSRGDTTSFPDAAAIALPASEAAPLVVMGATGAPVNAWHWRADEPEGARQISAEGLGTSRELGGAHVRARGTWKEGRWRVVIARALQIPGEAGAAQLEPGQQTGFGVAIWEGSRGERAGIKAFSGDWLPLELEPATALRRS
jgi:DMSO reductase family type II enzyme heme b subunit